MYSKLPDWLMQEQSKFLHLDRAQRPFYVGKARAAPFTCYITEGC